jgi:hypothetical protein
MRWIKAGGIGLVVLSLVLLGISALFPSEVVVSRAIDVYANRKVVMDNLQSPDAWKSWYPPALENQRAFVRLAAQSEEVLAIKEGKNWQEDPSKAAADTGIFIIPQNDSTLKITAVGGKDSFESLIRVLGTGEVHHCTIQWSSTIPVKWYPWEKFGSILYDKILGQSFENALSALKEKSEQQSPEAN